MYNTNNNGKECSSAQPWVFDADTLSSYLHLGMDPLCLKENVLI